jgi:hypothetical protein
VVNPPRHPQIAPQIYSTKIFKVKARTAKAGLNCASEEFHGPIGCIHSPMFLEHLEILFPLAAALNSLSGIKVPADINLKVFA